ncbi:protein TonB [Algoriphagus alkaliphilus]|uniref:Protein TonB n=1 Tax=Algoriphagus alkaliphilus TaxID=279824 RepID=A0A1G5YE26_9BACT|nr:energy transducer TonB [Algoriphagus alkaliphilus]MBA4298530.1 energy transducer TonB [Cyclobacterium sp.]SDA81001.1 protein TonB [Algoriphagus alkaliphilus]
MKTTLTIIALVFLTSFSAFSQMENLTARNGSDSSSIVPFRDMELPSFVGGQEAFISYIKMGIEYPKLPFKQGVEGTVLVNFRISKHGKILNPYVSKSVHPDLDERALELVKNMPDWIPASQNGNPREVGYQIPIRFALRD